MKKNSSSPSGRRGGKSRRGQKVTDPRFANVIVDTRKCLSMLRRVVRKNALPDVPAVLDGPWLN